jgi:hypothetical protein
MRKTEGDDRPNQMKITARRFECRTIAAVVLTAAFGLSLPAFGGQALSGAMPVEQQNALVQKYCAVCHDDTHKNGGLSLQHFDASRVEPSLAAMMISKLKTGAIGAAGLPQPDKKTQDGLFNALQSKSAGASEWALHRTQDPSTQAPLVTASIVREVPSTEQLYRVKVTCRLDTREAEMQLTWSPMSAQGRRTMNVAVDGAAPITFNIEGHEKMGNGAKASDGTDSVSGSAAAVLYTTHPSFGAPNLATPLPSRSLTVSNLFPNETVLFSFDRLTPAMRQELSTCFTENRTNR